MKNKTILISLETEKFLFFKIISSIIVALAPIAVAFVIDKRFIAMLPACILPLVYMVYRTEFLHKCSVVVNYNDKVVEIRKRNTKRIVPMYEFRWSAKPVGVRCVSYIIKLSANGKTLMKLRDDAGWNNINILLSLPHSNGKNEQGCIKRNR